MIYSKEYDKPLGYANFDKIYIIATINVANSGANGFKKYIINNDGTYTFEEINYPSITSPNWYNDDYMTIGYGLVTTGYYTVRLKKDAEVNGQQQSAGYEITWGWGSPVQQNLIKFP